MCGCGSVEHLEVNNSCERSREQKQEQSGERERPGKSAALRPVIYFSSSTNTVALQNTGI